MKKANIFVKTRDVFGRKTKKGKKEGLVPAVVYGRTEKSKSLWVKAYDLKKLFKEFGESTMIELVIDEKEKKNVIIYETQKDPLSGDFIHADFFQVKMDEEIETAVELVYIGEPPVVKEQGGILVKNLDEVTVKCLPGDLPSEIKVDLTKIKTFDDRICIKDLAISNKVKIDIESETVVVLATPPRSEAEMESLEGEVKIDVSKVEGVEKEAPAEEENKKEKVGEKK